jgi:hypothetical protein
MKILVFGNPLVEKDSLALNLTPKLREIFPEITFKEVDPTESLESEGKNLKVIDVAEPNFSEVRVLNLKDEQDFEKLQLGKVYSMHDFDLGYNLRLLKRTGLIDSVDILCIPCDMDEKKALDQSQLILRKWVAQDIQGS